MNKRYQQLYKDLSSFRSELAEYFHKTSLEEQEKELFCSLDRVLRELNILNRHYPIRTLSAADLREHGFDVTGTQEENRKIEAIVRKIDIEAVIGPQIDELTSTYGIPRLKSGWNTGKVDLFQVSCILRHIPVDAGEYLLDRRYDNYIYVGAGKSACVYTHKDGYYAISVKSMPTSY